MLRFWRHYRRHYVDGRGAIISASITELSIGRLCGLDVPRFDGHCSVFESWRFQGHDDDSLRFVALVSGDRSFSGMERFTFGQPDLLDGISFLLIASGDFAPVGSALMNVIKPPEGDRKHQLFGAADW